MPEPIEKTAKKPKTKTAPPAASPWSVRGVSPEARNAATLAARRAGKSLGTWVEGVVMAAAHAELKGAALPAPTTEDTLKAILSQIEKRETALTDLAAKVDALEQRKAGWLARLFGQ